MKASEIKRLTTEELEQKAISEIATYQKLKFAHAVSPIENPSSIKEQRRLVARLKTELTSRKNSK
ncbi:MAG: 50S ribosomal protein L29 [Bacteroidota bacterium]